MSMSYIYIYVHVRFFTMSGILDICITCYKTTILNGELSRWKMHQVLPSYQDPLGRASSALGLVAADGRLA